MGCIILILQQENGLVGIFSKMKHGIHVEYSTICGIRGHFKGALKIFLDLKSKICFHSFVGLDLEYRLSTHNMVISLELKAKKIKSEKSKKPTLSALLK